MMSDRDPDMFALQAIFRNYLKRLPVDPRELPDRIATELAEIVEQHLGFEGVISLDDDEHDEDPAVPETSRKIMALLDQAYIDAGEGRPIAATDRIVDCLDSNLCAENIGAAQLLLASIDTTRLPPEALTGTLSVGWHAKRLLGAAYTGFLRRVISRLIDDPYVSEERVDSIRKRFGDSPGRGQSR